MRTLAIAALLVAVGPSARADDGDFRGRDLCARDARHHGAPVDLDVKAADVHEVYRLLADIAKINVVISDDVSGKVTLRLKRVPWDAVACAVAGVQHLTIIAQDNLLLVTRVR